MITTKILEEMVDKLYRAQRQDFFNVQKVVRIIDPSSQYTTDI